MDIEQQPTNTVPNQPQASIPTQPSKDQPKSKLIWYLLAILVIALTGAAIWYYQTQVAGTSSRQSQKETVTSTPSTGSVSSELKEGGLVLLPNNTSKSPSASSKVTPTPTSQTSGGSGSSGGNTNSSSPDLQCPTPEMFVLQESNKILINLEPTIRFNGSSSQGKLTNTIKVFFAVPQSADDSTKPDRMYLTMHGFPEDYYAHTSVEAIDEVTGNTASLMTEVPIETKETDALKIEVASDDITHGDKNLTLYCVITTFKNPDLKGLTGGQIADGSMVVLAAHFAKNQQLYPVLFGYYEPKSVPKQSIYVGVNTAVGHAFAPFSYYLWLNAQITIHLLETN